MPTNNDFRGPSGFLPGCFVQGVNDISNIPIPTNGSLCLFPQYDYQAIHARQWTPTGVVSVKYIPEVQPSPSVANDQSSEMNTILDRLDNIEETLRRGYGRPRKKPYNKNSNYKKEESES